MVHSEAVERDSALTVGIATRIGGGVKTQGSSYPRPLRLDRFTMCLKMRQVIEKRCCTAPQRYERIALPLETGAFKLRRRDEYERSR